MPGHCDHFEATIWLQCQGPCDVELSYRKVDGDGPAQRTGVQQGDARKAYAMDFVLDKLEPGSWYTYEVFVNGRRLVTPEALLFRTQGLWKWRTDPPDFVVTAGSCVYVNEPAYDRPDGPKGPYGGDYSIFNSIADQEPDLMLWLGDNTYLREPDWGSWTGYLHRYTHTRSLPEMQRLLRNTQHYAIWDDHDFGPNDGDGSFVNAGLAREAFDLFWPNPEGRPTGLVTNTTSFSHGDVDFFLMDNRTMRVPPDVTTAKPAILGKDQVDWLVRALKYSDATFKIVAVGGQFLNDAPVFENHATVPAERQELIDRIDAEGITGVVFLSGDRHFSELSRMVLPNGNELHDLTLSPMTSQAYPPREENHLSVPGSRVSERNFGRLAFTGPRNERRLTISVHATDGTSIWEDSIPAPPRK